MFGVCVLKREAKNSIGSKENFEQAGAEQAADQRPHYWNPAVRPIRCSFTGNRQHKVGNTRTKIPRGVDCKARRTSEAQPNGNDKNSYNYCIKTLGEFICTNKQHCDHQHERPDDFTDEVGERGTDCRCTAEHRQFS